MAALPCFACGLRHFKGTTVRCRKEGGPMDWGPQLPPLGRTVDWAPNETTTRRYHTTTHTHLYHLCRIPWTRSFQHLPDLQPEHPLTMFPQAFENTSTNIAAAQMRNSLTALAETVKDPQQKKACYAMRAHTEVVCSDGPVSFSRPRWTISLPSSAATSTIKRKETKCRLVRGAQTCRLAQR